MSEELKPLYSDVMDIDKIVASASDGDVNVIYNLHEDILCLKEYIASIKKIPEGYALVPIIPTEEINEAYLAPVGYQMDGYPQWAPFHIRWEKMIKAAQESK